MIIIDEYVKPKSPAEAYTLLTTSENAVVVGGGFFIRLASRKIGVAIDLSQAGLDFIRETEQQIEIGAMTNFSKLAKSELLQRNLAGIIPVTVANLPGEQIRNMVSVGGTIYGKIGFSELLTSLMVLDCQVVLHRNGVIQLPDFLARQGKIGDIFEKLLITKEVLRASYQVFRNSAGSLPILTVAVSKCGTVYKIAVGSRPGVAALATEAMAYLSSLPPNVKTIAKVANMVSTQLQFGNDRRASEEYRRELCKTLVKRAISEVQ